MKKIKYEKKCVCLLLILIMLFSTQIGVYAEEKDQVLKVGFFEFDGYHNIDEDGCKSGYGYEFIQKMLRYNNYTAKYIGYEKNWAEMQEMLENGQIDILTSAQKTPEREELFDFSEPIGTSAAILTVKAGNNKYSAGEYNTYNGIRVGVIEGNSRNSSFEEYAKEKGFTYTLVYYDQMEELTNDLQKGKKIDAIVTSNLRTINNEWILDQFATSSFYAMVKKGNTALLDKINYAIDQMNSNSVGWKDELFAKYYSGSNGDSIALSSTEREYLASLKKSNKKIKVLVHPDKDPYCYVENGKAKGIIPDAFEEMAERLDLPYEYIIPTTRAEYAKLKDDKSADIILEARNDLSTFEDLGYKLTDPFINVAYATVFRTNSSTKIESVATINEAYTSDRNLKKLLKNKKVKYYNSMKECVKAVENNEVDACYLYEYSAQKFVNENISGDIQSTTIPDVAGSISLAVSTNDDYRLLAMLNKAVISVRENYVDTAITQNTDFSLDGLSFMQTMRRNPIIIMMILVLIFLIVILCVYGYLRKKNTEKVSRKNSELERFIGYVCKTNSFVVEANYAGETAKEYKLVDDHVKEVEADFSVFAKENFFSDIIKEDFDNIDEEVLTFDIEKIIVSGEEKYFECRFQEENEARWYAVTMSPVPVDSEHPQNILFFKRDIDDVKKKEEEARDSLKQALDAANQASVSKGSFLSNMSHEIRTPLNAIIGYLSLAQDKSISEEKKEACLDNCDTASKHLLQIINDVLDMSSIETGKLKIAHEDFDLKKEITDITTIFFQNAKSKGVSFETHISSLTEEWVVGDQLRLNQVLMNLLSNAIKFTPENGLVTLRINQIREDDKKVYIQFIVSDNGIGMSETYMSRIFDPFEQENAGTAKKYGGSGLGLSITHNLVKMMGGSISVDSKQDEGTTFTVTMYFDKSKVQHEMVSSQKDYSHVRVLVVDDKEDECTYVKTMLKRCGVKSDSVTSGEKALRRIKSRIGSDYSYNLCIIDWNMPEMNGCEVTSRIKAEIDSNIPIIIATAYDITAFQDEAKSAGADRIIAKPLFQSTLFDLLVSTFGAYNPQLNKETEVETVDMSGVRLLLVEDNPMNMDIAVTILEKAGVQVDQATNGKEAVETFLAAEKETYDLILMDVQMPIMDGYEATKEIRNSNHPEAKTIPIVAMTANAFAEDVTEALAKGMNAHIAKPINYDKLFEVIKKYQ